METYLLLTSSVRNKVCRQPGTGLVTTSEDFCASDVFCKPTYKLHGKHWQTRTKLSNPFSMKTAKIYMMFIINTFPARFFSFSPFSLLWPTACSDRQSSTKVR